MPFEDQVWKYIAERRPLKVVFVLVAVIGVISSAAKTIEPAWKVAVQLSNRYLASEPSPEVREKYGCAFRAGQGYWDFSRLVANTTKEQPAEVWIVNSLVQELRLCQRMYQFTPPIGDLTPKSANGIATADEIKLHFAGVTNSWNDFQAFLATKDRQALGLLRLGSEFSTAKMGLSYFGSRDPQGFKAALHEDLAAEVTKMSKHHVEAQSEFPFHLPSLQLDTATAETLFRSIVAAEARFAKYFRGDA